MARFTAGLLKTAMNNLYTHEKEFLNEYNKKLNQDTVIDHIINLPGDNLVSHTEQPGNNSQAASTDVSSASMTPGSSSSAQANQGVNLQNRPIYTRCERVHMLQIRSGHDQRLPLLVTLINAFLHYQTSPHLHANVSFSQHLHAVVAHFASLGPIARQYLLKTHTLSRLLRILLTYNNSASLPPEQVNESALMHAKLPLIEVLRDGE